MAAEEPKKKRRKVMEEKKKPGVLEKFFSKKRAPGDAPEGPEFNHKRFRVQPQMRSVEEFRSSAPATPGAKGSPMPLAVRCCRCDTEVSLKEATKKSRLTHVCHKCSRLGSRLN